MANGRSSPGRPLRCQAQTRSSQERVGGSCAPPRDAFLSRLDQHYLASSAERSIHQQLPPPARNVESRFLMVISRRDGKPLMPHRPDDVARNILAPVRARRLSVEKTNFSSEMNARGRAQIHDVVDRVAAARPGLISPVLRFPGIVSRQIMRRRTCPSKCGREEETVLILQAERRQPDR